MRKMLIIQAMNKRIYIDNPDNINIEFRERGRRSYKFNLKVDRDGLKALEKTLKTIRKRVRP